MPESPPCEDEQHLLPFVGDDQPFDLSHVVFVVFVSAFLFCLLMRWYGTFLGQSYEAAPLAIQTH